MIEDKINSFIKDPHKSLIRLSSPMIIAMVVQTMYNIVDTAFVGRLGSKAIAALTFSFPLFFILIAINSGLSAGMNSRISRFLGERKKEEAENAAMHGILMSLIVAIILIAIGIPTLKPLLVLFGAENEVLNLSVSYMLIILLGVIFMFPSFIMSSILSSQGDTKTPMKIQITALVLNAILDPIFIFAFGLGVAGAALATSISFLLSLLLFMYYIKRKSYLHIHKSSFHFSPSIIKEIVSIGAPTTLTMLLMSFYVIFLNKFMVHFGIEYVAAFGISTRLESVAMLPVIGLSLANLTLVSIFFGAKRYDLVEDVSIYSIKIAAYIASAVGLIFFLFPEFFLRVFTPETSLIAIGAPYIRIDVFTFPLMAISVMISRIMQGIGHGTPGLMINLIRIFIVALPLAYLFVFVLKYGYLSIAIAMVLGGLAAITTGFIWLKIEMKRMIV